MILVPNIFRRKFGRGGGLGRLFQETRGQWGPVGRLPMRVLTDYAPDRSDRKLGQSRGATSGWREYFTTEAEG